MKKDFEIGMKVFLNGEFGVVIKSVFDIPNFYGLIRWDTEKENDVEIWNGLFGSFIQNGGKVIDQSHNFVYINDDGALKE